MGPAYLEEKLTNKGLKIDRVRNLMSNREFANTQKNASDFMATESRQPHQNLFEYREKYSKGNDGGIKELEKTREFKMFHKLLLNVLTFDPDVGHLLMIMDQISHSESSMIQVLKIKRE